MIPSFEFNIPTELLFIPANISFISFSIFLSFILSKIFRSKLIFLISFISIFSFAYYDLIAKYSIKKFFEYSNFISYIYEYPIKNNSGKIDSLSMVGIYKYPLKLSNTLSTQEKNSISALHKDYIEKFIDITIYSYKYEKYSYKTQRIYLNNNEVYDDYEARYKVTEENKLSFLPMFYEHKEYKFIDTQNSKLLATASLINFLIDEDKFRNRFLYWDRQKEEQFNIKSIENFEEVYKKLFISGN